MVRTPPASALGPPACDVAGCLHRSSSPPVDFAPSCRAGNGAPLLRRIPYRRSFNDVAGLSRSAIESRDWHHTGRHAMVKLRVNGQEQSFDGDPSMPLLWYLRDELGLTGTKYGCGAALCGACTVHVDGAATRACVTTVSDASGRSVTTIEASIRKA